MDIEALRAEVELATTSLTAGATTYATARAQIIQAQAAIALVEQVARIADRLDSWSESGALVTRGCSCK
jgi:hypothetical protein